MNPEIKQKWLSALRSGKYKQGKGRLRAQDTFCCLGVLCDIAAKENLGAWFEFSYFRPNEGHAVTGVLPDSIVRWAELPDNNPYIISTPLARLNDSDNYDFQKIANLIEKHL